MTIKYETRNAKYFNKESLIMNISNYSIDITKNNIETIENQNIVCSKGINARLYDFM